MFPTLTPSPNPKPKLKLFQEIFIEFFEISERILRNEFIQAIIAQSDKSINKLFNEESIMEGIFKVLKNLASEFAMDIVSYIN